MRIELAQQQCGIVRGNIRKTAPNGSVQQCVVPANKILGYFLMVERESNRLLSLAAFLVHTFLYYFLS